MTSTLPPEKPGIGARTFLHKTHKLRQPKERDSKRVKLLQWQTQTLTQALELQNSLARSSSFDDGLRNLAKLLKDTLGCEDVSVSVFEGGKTKLKSMASLELVNLQSEVAQKHLAVHQETRLRNKNGVFPADKEDQDNQHLLVAHRQLALHERLEVVKSELIRLESDEPLGAITMTGTHQQLLNPKVNGVLTVLSSTLATQLDLLKRAGRKPRTRRTNARIRQLAIRVSCFTAVCLAIAACWIPIDYQINCRCVAEPSTRRFAVARFDGLISAGYAKPGDIVQEGDILARIDGRKTRWQMSSLKAQKQQSKQQRQLMLSAGNVTDTFLAELEIERLEAEEEILQFQLDNLEIKAPIDGVVLQGSTDRAEAAAVKTGQVLFEVGPLTPIELEASIPADQIALVHEGDQLSAWIEGIVDRKFEATILRIRPRAEIRNGRNVFVADIEIPNEENLIRPGMKGNVSVQGPKRTLGWIVCRQPYEYLRSYGWW